jgi:hypothetical protein
MQFGHVRRKTHKIHMNKNPIKDFLNMHFRAPKRLISKGLMKRRSNCNHSKVHY